MRKSSSLMTVVLVLCGCVTQERLEISAHHQFTDMRKTIAVSKDSDQRAYIMCVVDAVIAALDEPWVSMHWDVEIFASSDVNAFAMAGGKVGVFTGLLSVAHDQDQLATVIVHEIAHVTENHAGKRVGTAQAVEWASVLAAGAWGGTAGSLVGAGADVGILKPFSRGQESDADAVGLAYMARAGFNPLASIELWKNMDGNGQGDIPQFLSTHPSPENRSLELIAGMSEALGLYNDARASGREPQCSRH